jgi:hypothetical protein
VATSHSCQGVRFGVQGGDVEVVGVAGVDAGHRVGVGELPRREVFDRLGVLVVVVGDVVVVSSVLEDATAELVAGDADVADCGSSSPSNPRNCERVGDGRLP